MGDEAVEMRTLKEKLLFYTTAFFILLGTFSMFAFLFLVPFVIEPAFTTIFMQFEEVPALCETVETETHFGAKNCSWSSCREGCTKDIYTCTMIRVNYRQNLYNYTDEFNFTEYHINLKEAEREIPPVKRTDRYERAIRDYEYDIGKVNLNDYQNNDIGGMDDEFFHTGSSKRYFNDDEELNNLSASETLISGGLNPLDEFSQLSEDFDSDKLYFYVNARLFPNVKGCGYPPMLNCTIWLKRYTRVGIKFPCYYSKVDPGLVISDLDYWQNTLNLIYSMAIPIPSFIISVIYLTYAYFKIYNEDEETVPLGKNAEDMDVDEDDVNDNNGGKITNNGDGSQVSNLEVTIGDYSSDNVMRNGGPGMAVSQCPSVTTPGMYYPQSPSSSQLSPNAELNSFGHQLKVQMVDELSRDSLENDILSTSNSIQGNLSKTMTTSISTPPGPTAAV